MSAFLFADAGNVVSSTALFWEVTRRSPHCVTTPKKTDSEETRGNEKSDGFQV